jgi:hypothetical protein
VLTQSDFRVSEVEAIANFSLESGPGRPLDGDAIGVKCRVDPE